MLSRKPTGEGMAPNGPGEAGNDNAPFDPKAWRKKYMRKYMQARRDRIRAEKAAAKAKEQ
jgi:hypothetical protein